MCIRDRYQRRVHGEYIKELSNRMTKLIVYVLFSIALVSVRAVNEQGLQFREFLQGFTKGLGYPVPFQYIADKNIDETDINLPSLFQSIQQLAALDDTNIYKIASSLYDIRSRLLEFWNKRSQIVSGSSNLTQSLTITIRTFQDGAAFLFDAKRKGYFDDLKAVGLSFPKFSSYAGQELGFILRNCYGSVVSRFIGGLSAGLGYPVNKLYLINNDFSNATINVEELIKMLVLFKTSPYPPKRTVQLVLTEVDFELKALLRNRPDAIKGNPNLVTIFNQILPALFEDMFTTIQIIEENNLISRFPQVSDVVQEDIEQAGARLGFALKQTYQKVPKKTSLIEVPRRQRVMSFLRKYLPHHKY
eukprot:TRINITY_DN1123_c0_g2_i1.p1 TRINITY_DN1123_c0_g2~~TRINITY_DN1123_c0_g2_i1.p1  ORF type:complete len:387 (+),score=99.72 TRINITY_DN1123_c0_g2_i1:82-1161(+)